MSSVKVFTVINTKVIILVLRESDFHEFKLWSNGLLGDFIVDRWMEVNIWLFISRNFYGSGTY